MVNEKVVLASGGTGGHIFPAEALALELKARGIDSVLITDKRYDSYGGNLSQFEVHTISTSTFSGGILKKLVAVFSIFIGFFQAWKLLRRIKPKVVVGFGGYPSFPTMMMATRMGIKTVLHEQNSLLGHTNQVLSPRVDVIATSFAEVIGLKKDFYKKVAFVGNPVRPSIASLRDMPYPDLGEDSLLRILVLGGSQGASVFSRVVPEAIEMLPTVLRSRIRIDQQCREDDMNDTKAIYERIGVSADLATFFTDVPLRLASSHLVITRSGASTLSELTVAGRPAILVPYPHAKDDHQTINATSLEDSGGGWVMPQDAFTPTALSARIESFINLPSTLSEAAENAKASGRPDAANELTDIVQNMMEE